MSARDALAFYIGYESVDEDPRFEQLLNAVETAALKTAADENARLRARIAELERPAIEAKRNEIRSSYTELISTCEETKDFEGAFDVQCRLREREEQWQREDAENFPQS
ncbi:hypothetical protein [Streptomyces olivaceiscleroticus]|uniref:Uncharacterized protein n=1 Tax=Streptomyces olivaceiscleroticus TaxID=68245 RepID=A0ABP3LHG7_9ACTN